MGEMKVEILEGASVHILVQNYPRLVARPRNPGL